MPLSSVRPQRALAMIEEVGAIIGHVIFGAILWSLLIVFSPIIVAFYLFEILDGFRGYREKV